MSPIIFVNHTARCSLAPRWNTAWLVLVGPADTVCKALTWPISTARSTSHPCSPSTRMTSCRELGWCLKLPQGWLPRHAQHLYPRPQAHGPAGRGCWRDRVLCSCPAADIRSAAAPRHSGSPRLWEVGLLPGSSEGKRFGLWDRQPAARFWLLSVVTEGTVGPEQAGTNATLHSSEFTGNVLRSSGGQRWAEDKSCSARFSSPTPFACCVCSVWFHSFRIKFPLSSANTAYFQRAKSDTIFSDVNPFAEGSTMESGWLSSERCVIAIESSCSCQSY